MRPPAKRVKKRIRAGTIKSETSSTSWVVPIPLRHPEQILAGVNALATRTLHVLLLDRCGKPVAAPGEAKDPWGLQSWLRFNQEAVQTLLFPKSSLDPERHAARFKLCLYLLTFMDKKNRIHDTQGAMAEALGLSAARCSGVLKDLVAMGCIQKVGGQTKKSFIRLNPNLFCKCTPAAHRQIIDEWNQAIEAVTVSS